MSQAVGTCPVTQNCLVMNGPVNGQWLLGVNVNDGCQTVYRTYGKSSDMTLPGPSSLWVFCDEHPDSINDAMVAVQMVTIDDIIDVPASYHNGAGGFAFADGHSEIHKWKTQGMQPPVTWNTSSRVSSSIPGSAPDLMWLQQRTSARKSANF